VTWNFQSLTVIGGGVAIDAGEAGVVGRNLMAIVADGAMMRNREIGMAIGGIEPSGSVVTGVARCGKARSDVIRNGAAESLRALPSGRVAAVASSI
jgi:hypothetical protein